MPTIDFIEEKEAPKIDFQEEEPVAQQPQYPTLDAGASLSDVLNQPARLPGPGGVVRSVLPGVLQPEDLLPAVRKIGGETITGEQGDTHPDIIKREGIPAIELDQRGFTGPRGEFYDRESAAQGLRAPTAFEPGRLHSTDLRDLQGKKQALKSQMASLRTEGALDKASIAASDIGQRVLYTISLMNPGDLFRKLVNPNGTALVPPEQMKRILYPAGGNFKPGSVEGAIGDFIIESTSSMTQPDVAAMLALGKTSPELAGRYFQTQMIQQSPEAVARLAQAKTPAEAVKGGLETVASVGLPLAIEAGLRPPPAPPVPDFPGSPRVLRPGARPESAPTPERLSPEAAAIQAEQMQREAVAGQGVTPPPAPRERVTVPEGPAEAPPTPEPVTAPVEKGVGWDDVVAELQSRGTGKETINQIREMFPQIKDRETARRLGRDAFGDDWGGGGTPPPGGPPPSGPTSPPPPVAPTVSPEGGKFLDLTKDAWTPESLEASLATEGNRRAIVNGINTASELKRRVPLKPDARAETILKAIHDLIDARSKQKAQSPAPTPPSPAPIETPVKAAHEPGLTGSEFLDQLISTGMADSKPMGEAVMLAWEQAIANGRNGELPVEHWVKGITDAQATFDPKGRSATFHIAGYTDDLKIAYETVTVTVLDDGTIRMLTSSGKEPRLLKAAIDVVQSVLRGKEKPSSPAIQKALPPAPIETLVETPKRKYSGEAYRADKDEAEALPKLKAFLEERAKPDDPGTYGADVATDFLPEGEAIAAKQQQDLFNKPVEGKGLAGNIRKRLEAGENLGGESGGGQLHQMVYDFGKSIYEKGMTFAQWSAHMVKELGEQAKNLGGYLRDLWESITGTGPTPAVKQFSRSMMEAKRTTTQGAYRAGEQARDIADLEYLAKANDHMRKNMRAASVAKNIELMQKWSGVQFPREAIEAAVNFGSAKGALTKAPLDWKKNPEVAQWIVNNAHRFGWDKSAVSSLKEVKTSLTAPKAELVHRPLSTIEAGAGIPIPRDITDTLKKSRDTLKTLWKTKSVRDVMTYLKDVAGNKATVYGQRVGNNVRGELRRSMGRGTKPNVLDENALTFVREADGDPSQLMVMRGKLNASTAADPKWKAAALKAIDHAEANWGRINPIASKYEAATDAQVASENAAGINTIQRKGYVMHAQDVENEFGFFSNVAGEGTSGFKHTRTHDTFADSIAAGIDPKTLNGVALLSQRIARGQMMINNRAWVEGLRTTIDPQTRKAVITEPEIVSRGPGLPPDVRAPTDYVTEIAGGRPIAVLKSYAGVFRALTEPSKFSESLGWNMALKAATTGKHIALMLDTFHLGRIAFWESVIKPLSFTDPKLPLPSYKRGVLTLDYSPAELQRMANAGEIYPTALPEILTAQRDVNGLVKHGYNVAKISDQLHQEWLQKIPITGTFNKWLFNQFQRGAMAEVGAMEVPRYRRMHPSWTDERVYREVAKDLNTRFGNLGRQGLLKSKTAQDTARLLFLAPQWNEGLIRSEVGAITGIGKGIASSVKEGRLSFGILPRAVGAMLLGQFAANQIINYATRGKPTWENEEEGVGAKLSAWIPDLAGKGPGFFLHPAGLAAEITHLLSQKYEKKGDFREALMAFMGGRWSTLARPAVTFLTRRDIFQRLIRPENVWKETAKSALPTPIGASAAAPAAVGAITGESKEPYPGAYQRQMMSSAGIKTDPAESSGQRISSLARNWKQSQGVKQSGEFYESAYAPLRQSLRRNNRTEIRENLRELLKTGHKPEKIENAIKPWTGEARTPKPFTGSQKTEAQFIRTLTPEQRATYRKAMIERLREYQTFQRALAPTP